MARIDGNRGYRIAPDRRAITCLVCGATSYTPSDIDRLFCPVCDAYHEDRELLLRLERDLCAAR